MAWTFKHTTPDYSTPKAAKYLDMALECEAKGMADERVNSMLNKAVEAEASGE